ncbi:hypothetical protein HHL17_23900 [Chitinophaga sp. G-6-1-13]|uniref:Uncharacterized protein n=1 Tax=Chitinophaga fulva TaxID=2728842 RepID=A0A848GPD2_9BACT|nr:hypothetical protein [Chitinophaga fulva]NML40264.1 hypothetical protein [Chitinophaga fulva]
MKIPYLLCCFLVVLSSRAYSQNIDILSRSDTFERKGKHRDFIYWNNPSDSAGLEYVATLSSKGSAMGGSSLWEIWSHAGNRSTRMGSNVFIFRSFTDSDSTKPELIVDLYLATDEALQRNAGREEKNVVYLFGNKGKAMSVKVNAEQKDIPANGVLRYEVPAGEELKLSKGGATGAWRSIKGEACKAALYFSISGPGLGGAVPPAGSVGISFNSGRITEMNPHFARMMLTVQQQAAK